jgi:adenosylcobyric acid synthase
MGFAEAAGVPVVLVADIERGGVIASLVGTWGLISEAERAHTKGFIVNKFRGDAALFTDGARAIEARTGLTSFGVLPYLVEAGQLPREDSMALAQTHAPGDGAIRIVVPRLPHISNFDDLDPLIAEAEVSVEFVAPGRALPGNADLVVLAGSKSTRIDLAALKAEGWHIDIAAHVRRGGHVLGICGGYQMLGREVADTMGIEGPAGRSEGLGLLDVATRLTETKTLTAFPGGYEMHMGETHGPDCVRPMLRGGAVSPDGRVMGCYVHGLFADDSFRSEFLRKLKRDFASDLAYGPRVEAALDAIAAAIEQNLDVPGLMATATPIAPG